ncbi:hypothetical protein BpHYR1_013781 [Brachionus plicatilis]|uniref:Uncharacterized protein n=1 Tax=Brachionus plicatilis TaxID=10195 RepID=A0A3M7RAW5_BRAPC|nr:hypothetical protein BpHYR1_013781 [Brachionus plicatilis]
MVFRRRSYYILKRTRQKSNLPHYHEFFKANNIYIYLFFLISKTKSENQFIKLSIELTLTTWLNCYTRYIIDFVSPKQMALVVPNLNKN